MFKLNPLILGELHGDLVTMRWLIDNLDLLKRVGYTSCAFEYDQSATLDDRITKLKTEIEILKTEYQNPQTIETFIEENKRDALIGILNQSQPSSNVSDPGSTSVAVKRLGYNLI